jgi:hypothetical protein
MEEVGKVSSLTVMVDSCLVKEGISDISVEIESNASVARKARETIVEILAKKGYPVAPESVVTVGATLSPGRLYSVIEDGQEYTLQPSLGVPPPFYGEPAWWREKRTALNELFTRLAFVHLTSASKQQCTLPTGDLGLPSDTALVIQLYGVSPSDGVITADLVSSLVFAVATRGHGTPSSGNAEQRYWVGFHLLDIKTGMFLWSDNYRVKPPWTQLSPPDAENALDLVREVIQSLPALRPFLETDSPSSSEVVSSNVGKAP